MIGSPQLAREEDERVLKASAGGGTQYLVFNDFQSKRLGEEGIQLALL